MEFSQTCCSTVSRLSRASISILFCTKETFFSNARTLFQRITMANTKETEHHQESHPLERDHVAHLHIALLRLRTRGQFKTAQKNERLRYLATFMILPLFMWFFSNCWCSCSPTRLPSPFVAWHQHNNNLSLDLDRGLVPMSAK